VTANGCGKHARWTTGCPGCQTLARMYDRRRKAAIADGTWLGSVDASDVRAHLDRLLDAGMNLATIATLSGLAKSTVLGVRKRQWVQGPTAEALFAVKPAPIVLPPAGMVSVVGATRRVQALCWMGWSLQAQADRIGMYMQQVWQVAHGKQSAVTTTTDATFRALFEQLSATRGPSVRAHNAAVRSGWVPPLAWDDIDDPAGVPDLGGDDSDHVDEVAVERAVAGGQVPLSELELRAVLKASVARGVPVTQLTQRFGVSDFIARRLISDVETPKRRKKAELEEVLARMGHLPDSNIAALVGVHHQTVTRARQRMAGRQNQLAS
jgi:predicted nucleic acid-binding protein